MSDHELREVVANCCGDDADPCLSCRQVQRGIDTIERLERELAEAKAAMSRCLLGDPPGDCYAAESITQRVRAERYRKALHALVEDMELVLSHDGLPESDALRAARDALGEG